MDTQILKVVGQIAGIGGLALGVLLLLYRELIRKDIFPTLRPMQAYRIIRLLLILVWTIALAGLAAWVYTAVANRSDSTATARLTKLQEEQREITAVLGKNGLWPASKADSAAQTPSDAQLQKLLTDPQPEPFGLVCRKRGIAGYDLEYSKAARVLPNVTSDYNQMAVYIGSLPNGVLYAHSNFVTKGYDAPTKIVTNRDIDLEQIVENLVFDRLPTAGAEKGLRTALKTTICVFIDDSLLSRTGRLALNINGASKVFVVKGGMLQTLDHWRMESAYGQKSG